MDLIRSSAHHKMCACGRHAHTIFSDGSVSPDYGSRKVGLNVVEEALKEKKLTPEEGHTVIEQIMHSPLPIERGWVDDKLDYLREVQALLRLRGVEISLSSGHHASESDGHKRPLKS